MECVESYLEDFAVDDLLDLSVSDDFEGEEARGDEDEREPEKDCNFSDQSVCLEDSLSFPGTELQLPVGDLAELEWLSNFVDDSFSESYLSGDFPVKPTSGNEEAPTTSAVESRFNGNAIPVKPRTKRKRTRCHVWSPLPPPCSPETPVQAASKKGKKRVRRKACAGPQTQTQTRRCSHCGVQKTPQWRMGPLGAKTLCNACGVRFKSGRLLPEYRPACSPTFSSLLHSNSHRKVLELRQTKSDFPGSGRVESHPV